MKSVSVRADDVARRGSDGAPGDERQGGRGHQQRPGRQRAVLVHRRGGRAHHRPDRLAVGRAGGLARVHPVLLTAGLMGASLVFAIAWLIPQIGAGPMTFALLAGQIVGGMVLSHYGWLGSPVQPISPINALGALVMLGGVFLRDAQLTVHTSSRSRHGADGRATADSLTSAGSAKAT